MTWRSAWRRVGQWRHYRLLQRHGLELGRTAIYWATVIVDGWTTRVSIASVACRPASEQPWPAPAAAAGVLRMVNHPEGVTLAGLPGAEEWRSVETRPRAFKREPDRAPVSR